MAHGVVHWEIGGRDLDKLAAFYHDLFGWDAPAGPDPNYRMVETDDGIGGGLMQCTPQMPPYVSVYVAVDDLGAALTRAGELGGSTLVPPQPIPGVGSFAMFRDPEGNVVGMLHMAGEDARADGTVPVTASGSGR